jgi:WD40 repeat protein
MNGKLYCRPSGLKRLYMAFFGERLRTVPKDERRILSWSSDQTLRLWDVATGQQIGPAMKHDGPITAKHGVIGGRCASSCAAFECRRCSLVSQPF